MNALFITVVCSLKTGVFFLLVLFFLKESHWIRHPLVPISCENPL